MKRAIELQVNGEPHELLVAHHWTLLEVLRDGLGLTGTKRGCDYGTCGACTVLVEGRPFLSCLTLASSVRGKGILTIEGLAPAGQLHPLQQAAVEYGAVQCGFCTPGWLLTAKALLEENPRPSQEEVRAAIAGNLCRCTGYAKIVQAILVAAQVKV